METIMSTLTWGPAVAAAAGPPESLLAHLLKAYQRQAERQIVRYLGQQNEARLARLGFAPEEIAALHQGRLQGPGHAWRPGHAEPAKGALHHVESCRGLHRPN